MVFMNMFIPADQTKIDTCLQDAQNHFLETARLNSHPSDKGNDVIIWNSDNLRNNAYERLDADRKLCLDLYK